MSVQSVLDGIRHRPGTGELIPINIDNILFADEPVVRELHLD